MCSFSLSTFTVVFTSTLILLQLHPFFHNYLYSQCAFFNAKKEKEKNLKVGYFHNITFTYYIFFLKTLYSDSHKYQNKEIIRPSVTLVESLDLFYLQVTSSIIISTEDKKRRKKKLAVEPAGCPHISCYFITVSICIRSVVSMMITSTPSSQVGYSRLQYLLMEDIVLLQDIAGDLYFKRFAMIGPTLFSLVTGYYCCHLPYKR